jgi:chemotaxis protein methyltransferase CheR
LCQRAQRACYQYGSIKNLPSPWREQVFTRSGDEYCLKAQFRDGCEFVVQDVREAMPEEMFDLVLCRNLVFTYFETGLQREILERMTALIRPRGVLVTGIHESLPEEATGFECWSEKLHVFRKAAAG